MQTGTTLNTGNSTSETYLLRFKEVDQSALSACVQTNDNYLAFFLNEAEELHE